MEPRPKMSFKTLSTIYGRRGTGQVNPTLARLDQVINSQILSIFYAREVAIEAKRQSEAQEQTNPALSVYLFPEGET